MAAGRGGGGTSATGGDGSIDECPCGLGLLDKRDGGSQRPAAARFL
jgi:hypothetical protein